jgi:hypothetical protein
MLLSHPFSLHFLDFSAELEGEGVRHADDLKVDHPGHRVVRLYHLLQEQLAVY